MNAVAAYVLALALGVAVLVVLHSIEEMVRKRREQLRFLERLHRMEAARILALEAMLDHYQSERWQQPPTQEEWR